MQVLVHVSTYQGSILGTGFLSHSHVHPWCRLPKGCSSLPVRQERGDPGQLS